jgi:hypothetical protein
MQSRVKNMWKHLIAVIALVGSQAYAITTEEKQGEAAGRYFGAIVLASEFSKTSCGKTAKLSERLTNTSLAVDEIKKRFQNIDSKELGKAFSKNEELKQRQEMRDFLGTMKLDKCDLAKQTLIPYIEKEIESWKAFR